MFTALTFILVPLGILLLYVFPWAGLGCLAFAYLIRSLAIHDEEAFLSGLMLLGAIGAASEVIVDLFHRFIAL